MGFQRLQTRNAAVHLILWSIIALPCLCLISGGRSGPRGLEILSRSSRSTQRHLATSSADLKKKKKGNKDPKNSKKGRKPSKKFPKNSVVTRLSNAAARAAAVKAKRTESERSSLLDDKQAAPPVKKPLGSLRQLTKAIDQQLQFVDNEKNLVADTLSILRPARDSMSAVVDYNFRQPEFVKSQRHVAVIFAKPLIQDQVTVEYANRIRRLVTAMQREEYEPDVIAFIGGCSSGGYVADADAGYVFLRHLCASQQVSLTNVTFHMEHSYIRQGALLDLVHHVQQTRVPAWREAIRDEYIIAPTYDYMSGPAKRRRQLQVHFSLVSSEYHLCQLHDIHIRSPGQSKLEALQHWGGRVETSWSYLYATTARVASSDPALAYCGKSYQTVQELVPVLLNLQGVVDDREFFQRDNYRVLVAARRSLVTDMEGLYRLQPSLEAVRQIVLGDNRRLDVVMEGALLSLGRCLDLVRPAGMLTQMVPMNDWVRALSTLENAVNQISVACDPDNPLEPSEWGSMGEPDDHLGDDRETLTATEDFEA